jgi:hypothetical protein
MKTLTKYFSSGSMEVRFCLTTVVILLAAFLSVNAQSNLFAYSVTKQFGFEFAPSNNLIFHALADIDGDGDLDDFVSHRHFVSPCWVVSAFEFYENQGSSVCPEYVKIPDETFGLPALTATITFVDIDNDGDQDAFISNHCWVATVTYHENTGNATDPQFSSTPTQTLNTNWNIGFAMPAFGDLDGDGDYDALVNGLRPAVFKYIENTGTPESFEFAAPVTNPFGLSIPSVSTSEWSQFADWDCDGDLDIINSHWQGGDHNDWMLYLHINNGTPTAPAFLSPTYNNHFMMAIAVADMDGDGDVDVLSDEYYFKNISTSGCVMLPTAGFSMVKNGLTIGFVNESAGLETACNPISYRWNFGDGTTSQEAAPEHTYTAAGNYNVSLKVEDIAGQAVFSENVEVTLSAVADQKKAGEVEIFPNPVSGILTLKMAEKAFMRSLAIEVFNSLGEVVMRLEQDAPDFSTGVRMDVSALESGFYTLKIGCEEGFLSGKFFKIK